METISGTLHDKLRDIVGEAGILPETQIAAYTFDNCVPKAVVLPASVREMQAVLRFAAAQHLSVMPAGAGTKLGIGNLPQKVDMVLSTTRLNSVVEYEPADLTVTVESGIRLAALQAELTKHRQFLPLNPPYADRCTLGGVVATNASGSLRLRHGTARNQVLGMHVVHANGNVVKSGGKVVKNVAGYDLNKLYIGAFGTLGIITEITLKLAPVPIQQVILTTQFQNIQDAVDTGLSVVRSQALPIFTNLFINSRSNLRPNATCISEKTPTLVVGFGGDTETVRWQQNHVQTIMEQNGATSVTIREGESCQSLQDAMRKFPEVNGTSDDRIIAKVNLKRTDIAEFAQKAITPALQGLIPKIPEETGEMMALLGSGVLYLAIPIASVTDFQPLADTLTQLRQRAMAAQGNLIIEAAPPELKRHIDVWGSVGSMRGLMKQVKAKFDADGLLNPGRFVSSI